MSTHCQYDPTDSAADVRALDGLRDIGQGAREIGAGIKTHAQAVEKLARALEFLPSQHTLEVRLAPGQLHGATLFLVGLALVAGVVIGRLAGRFRT